MRTAVAYVLALTAAPFLGVILSLIPGFFIIGALGGVAKRPAAGWAMMVVATVPTGILIGWLGLLIFDWLGTSAMSTVLVAQAIFIALASFTRFRQGVPFAGAQGTGQTIGLALAGQWLL